MVIFQILLLNDKRVLSKERNTVRASNSRAILTWTDNTSKVGYVPMQSAFNNRKVQNGIDGICHVLLTDGQIEMRFPFLCFLIKREHF